jgi:hypothetical protein
MGAGNPCAGADVESVSAGKLTGGKYMQEGKKPKLA